MSVPTPGKIVCVGRNYAAHARELGNALPERPLIFLKPPSAVIGSGDVILLPAISSRVEFEGEIGLVIGRRLRRATERDAADAIAGICPVNDVTARDLQQLDGQWARAKGCDTFCPVGPVAPLTVPLDAIEIVTRLNGGIRQRATSAEMIFAIPELLAYISAFMTLEPGDLILTGTPEGVGPLSPGDRVEVEIPGVGLLHNPVARANE
ncbi:MAG TPA: fumarylacetoacetate hydrolase family protein [Gemmatimonadales bacterium]|nr:fumarylacetoacetate hydrolase family protein [Gemmatimonadales bacterium]